MWYYATKGQPHGPFDDAALDQLIAGGSVTNDTIVWKEGMPEWTPLGQVRNVNPAGLPGRAAEPSTCTMCGRNVGADNLIDLLGHRVCAACKPTVVQTLREGVVPVGANTAWRDGKKVVTMNEASLPRRCYKCNHESAEAPRKHKLYWHPAGYYWLIALGVVVRLGIIIYVIVAMFVRKRATVEVFLCTRHTRRRQYFIIGGFSVLVLAIALTFTGIATSMAALTGIGALLILPTLLIFIFGTRLARATKITDNTVWMSGAGKEFLASLPEWTRDTPSK